MARQQTEHAAAAKMIRKDLARNFPTVKFAVHSRSFAGGDAVDVEWTDGPSSDQVEEIVGQYEYGHFDGMEDLYHYSNVRSDIPQAKYVQTRRSMSRDAYRATVAYLNRRYGWNLVVDETADYNCIASGDEYDRNARYAWRSHEINPTFHKQPLLCPIPSCQAAILPGDRFCPSCGHSFFEEQNAA